MPHFDNNDIPRFYTAIAECSACAMYWFLLPRRIRSAVQYVILTVLFLAADGAWLVLTDNVPNIFWIPCMAAAFCLMYGYTCLILKGSAADNFYTALKSLLVAEFMASLEWQIEFFLKIVTPLPAAAYALVLVAVYGFILVMVYLVEKSMMRGEFRPEFTWREIFPAALIVIISFLSSNLSFVFTNTPFSGQLITDIFNIRTLVDLAGLAFVYAFQSRSYEIAAEKELSNINSMLKAQYEHYRNYQDSINLINFKYHDLKHQLAGLRAVSNPEERNAWIDSMSRELENYKPETQTGNQVLDGILDQKMPMIRNNKIKFTCVADGKLVDFMHVTDICTIFGNALDNAIENVVTIEDPEKRMIHMNVSAHKQFLYIEVDDYCEHEIRFRNGFPETTKKDSRNHGFGVKSIAYTAEKYGGSVSFRMNNNMFEMKVIIPIPQ